MRAALIASSLALLIGAALAQDTGGSITGFVTVPSSVKNIDKLIVLACAEQDEMCAKPVQVIALGGKAVIAVKDGRKIAYSFVRLPAGKYAIYALNDTTANQMHDPDTEEIGGYFTPGTFDPILVTPPARGINLELIPLE